MRGLADPIITKLLRRSQAFFAF